MYINTRLESNHSVLFSPQGMKGQGLPSRREENLEFCWAMTLEQRNFEYYMAKFNEKLHFGGQFFLKNFHVFWDFGMQMIEIEEFDVPEESFLTLIKFYFHIDIFFFIYSLREIIPNFLIVGKVLIRYHF